LPETGGVLKKGASVKQANIGDWKKLAERERRDMARLSIDALNDNHGKNQKAERGGVSLAAGVVFSQVKGGLDQAVELA